MKKHKDAGVFLHIAIIILVGAVCYVNALSNGFVWDDQLLVLGNSYIRSFEHITSIFTTTLFQGTDYPVSNFYRPIQNVILLLCYQIWKLNPFGYHLINILIHVINAVLLYLLVSALFKKRKAALLAALLFVAHPVNTEAVTYVSGMADPLATLFMLLSFLSFINLAGGSCVRWWQYPVSLMLFLMAPLSKESSLIYPFILACYMYLFVDRSKHSVFKRVFPFFVLGGVYYVIRHALGFDAVVAHAVSPDFSTRLCTFFYVFAKYCYLLIIPAPLHMEYVIACVRSLYDVRVLPFIGVFLAFTFLLLQAFKKSRQIFFGLAWFLIALIPVSGIFIPLNAQMAEHWLYLPAIGMFIAVSLMAAQFLEGANSGKRRAFLCVVVCLISCYVFLTIKQNQRWKDEKTFYNYTLRYAPRSARVYYNLGGMYRAEGKFADAIEKYSMAIDINPQYVEAINNVGNCYAEMGDDDRAIEEFKRSIHIQPNYVAYNSLGISYFNKKESSLAIEHYRRAIGLNPASSKAFANLGNAYYVQNDMEGALSSWERALKLDPSNVTISTNLMLLKKGRK